MFNNKFFLYSTFWMLSMMGFSLAEDKIQPDSLIFHKAYKMLSYSDEKELGIYRLKAILSGADRKIKIVESVLMKSQGQEIGYKSIVIYENTPIPSPTRGTVETMVDGNVWIKGVISFSEKTISLVCYDFANVPPKKVAPKDFAKPDGILIFQSALPAIAPKLQPKEGELENIVYVIFPHEIETQRFIYFDRGYRLVREKADEKGDYDVRIINPDSQTTIFYSRFNKENQIVTISPFRKYKLVEFDVQEKEGIYNHPGSDMDFPEDVGRFQRIKITQHEPEKKDKNVQIDYLLFEESFDKSPEVRVLISVYVYPASVPDLAGVDPKSDAIETKQSQLFQEHVESVKNATVSVHLDAALISDKDFEFTEGGRSHKGRKIIYEYKQLSGTHEDKMISQIYLFQKGTWIIKYRVTFFKAIAEKSEVALEEFLRNLSWPKR